MDEKIEKLVDLCGTKNKLQYLLLFISFICWSNNMLTQVALPFLEKTQNVEFFDENGNKVISNLNYTICEWDKSRYNITETFEYSWVIQTGVECDPLKTGFLGAAAFCGNFFAAITFNLLVDSIGRKNTFKLSLLCFVITNTFIIFMKNFYPIVFSSFVVNIFGVYANYTCLLLTEELTSSSIRGLFSTIINIGFPFCALIFFPLFSFLHKWQYVFMINSGISFLMLLLFICIQFESPRYLISIGKVQQATTVIRNIAKFHGIQEKFEKKINSEEYREIVLFIHQNVTKNLVKDKETKDTKQELGAFSLIKYPSIRYKFLIMSFVGFSVSGTYNSVTIWMKNLPGDLLILGLIFYVFEVIVGLIAGCIMETRAGRKGTMLGCLAFAFAGFFSFVVLGEKDFLIKIISFLVIKFSINAIFGVMYSYFLESYPTKIRAIGFGINTSIDNFGGILFPIATEFFKERKLFLVLGLLCLSNIILINFIPETKGVPLPETVKEMEMEEKEESMLSNEEQL